MILTHYSINEKNYEKIYDLCKRYNVNLIEDSAISLGGFSNNIPVGKFSDAVIFSFSAFKYLNFFYPRRLIYLVRILLLNFYATAKNYIF